MFDIFKKDDKPQFKPLEIIPLVDGGEEKVKPTEPTEEVAKKLCGCCRHRQTTKCLLNGGVMSPDDYCSQHAGV